jgi:hypothetical protein
VHLSEAPFVSRATVRVHQERPVYGLYGRYEQVGEDSEASNIITDAGRVQMHAQLYGSAAQRNGWNYIALSGDGTTPSPSDTVLAGEIIGSGVGRTKGTVTLPTGSGTSTTVANRFIYAGGGSQLVQKMALFNAPYDPFFGGVMNHEIQFTPHTLFANDVLTLTVTITTS